MAHAKHENFMNLNPKLRQIKSSSRRIRKRIGLFQDQEITIEDPMTTLENSFPISE